MSGCSVRPNRAKRSRNSGEKLLGVVSMLEPHDEVVGKPHDDHVAVRLPLPPSVGPEVEDVVQVDIGQERADTAALDRADLTDDALPLLQHAGVQPFLDEPHDAPVRHTVLDEPHQPSVLQGVEEARMSASSTQFTVLRHDADRQRIQREMRAALRAGIRTRTRGSPCRRSRSAPRRRRAGRSCPPAWELRAAAAARPPSGCTRDAPASLGTRLASAGPERSWRFASRASP